MAFSLLFTRRLLFIFGTIALLSSCAFFDTSETIPSYIHIDKIAFVPGSDTTTGAGGQGTASSNITDAWVYVDEQLQGIYELPCTFPVQYEGTHTIKVAAGIKMNGIGATRVIYPFFDFYTTTVTLTPKQTTTINPHVSYYSTVQFPYLENFESTYCFVDSFGDTPLRDTNGAVAWGGGWSAYGMIKGNALTFQSRTCTTYALNADGQPKFIELNYKCNHPFVVGLLYGNGTEPVVGVNPSDKWNKIYLNISDQILLSGTYGFYFAMQKLPSDTGNPTLYIDNVKLVHF
jgi:hypothetical protein